MVCALDNYGRGERPQLKWRQEGGSPNRVDMKGKPIVKMAAYAFPPMLNINRTGTNQTAASWWRILWCETRRGCWEFLYPRDRERAWLVRTRMDTRGGTQAVHGGCTAHIRWTGLQLLPVPNCWKSSVPARWHLEMWVHSLFCVLQNKGFKRYCAMIVFIHILYEEH